MRQDIDCPAVLYQNIYASECSVIHDLIIPTAEEVADTRSTQRAVRDAARTCAGLVDVSVRQTCCVAA